MQWLGRDDVPPAKCLFTFGLLPRYIDATQPPTKRKPFSSIRGQQWSHAAHALVPAESLVAVRQELARLRTATAAGEVRYAKVIMALGDVLAGDFFNVYVKQGNVMMLSEGRPGVDRIFSLHEGILRLEVDKATYERLGLVGKLMPDGGVKHKSHRYVVETNLRLPSMVRGRKGFERLLYACKHVLTESLTWLFRDCNAAAGAASEAPIETHHPRWLVARPDTTLSTAIRIPLVMSRAVAPHQSNDLLRDGDFMNDLEEWLCLAALGSPRLQDADRIDPYLCRYSVPVQGEPNAADAGAGGDSPYDVGDVAVLRWHGFLSATCVTELFIALRRATSPGRWAAMLVSGFRDEQLAILTLPSTEGEDHFLEWDGLPRR